MTTLAADPELWSRRRWVTTVIFLVAVQAGLALVLSDRSPVVVRQDDGKFSARVITDPGTSRALFDSLAVGDPTLLTLIHPQSFARGRPQFTAPELPQPWDLTEPPHWLSQDPARLGATFASFLRTNPAFPVLADEKPAPSAMAVATALPLLDRESSLSLEGDLAARELRGPVKLPVWTNGDLVANTVILVSVNAAGEVFAPRVEKGGVAAGVQHDADLYAVGKVRMLHFKPLPATGVGGQSLSSGKIVFRWRTVPPASADGTTVPPPP